MYRRLTEEFTEGHGRGPDPQPPAQDHARWSVALAVRAVSKHEPITTLRYWYRPPQRTADLVSVPAVSPTAFCYKKQPGPGNCVRKRVTHHVRHTRKHECDGMISASVVELGEHGHPTLYPMRLGNGGRNEDVQDEVGRVAYDRNTQKSNPVWLNALTPYSVKF